MGIAIIELPEWQCSYVNSKGVRCTKCAVNRIHFSADHPFDHVDLCDEHLEEYRGYVWTQNLKPN